MWMWCITICFGLLFISLLFIMRARNCPFFMLFCSFCFSGTSCRTTGCLSVGPWNPKARPMPACPPVVASSRDPTTFSVIQEKACTIGEETKTLVDYFVGCGSALAVVKWLGNPHNGHSTSRPFAWTMTMRDGTGAWTHELAMRPSISIASWSCCIMTVHFWQSRCRSWVMATYNAAKPKPTPANSMGYAGLTPVVSLTGYSFWNAAGRCNALQCNGHTRCKHCQGST